MSKPALVSTQLFHGGVQSPAGRVFIPSGDVYIDISKVIAIRDLEEQLVYINKSGSEGKAHLVEVVTHSRIYVVRAAILNHFATPPADPDEDKLETPEDFEHIPVGLKKID